MTKRENKLIYVLAVVILFAMTLLLTGDLYASHNSQHVDVDVTINDITEVTEVNRVFNITGVSNDVLDSAVVSLAAINHPFDFSTNDYQMSVNAAYYKGKNAGSLGIAKRFKKVDALWHGSYTQNQSHAIITAGAVFRF